MADRYRLLAGRHLRPGRPPTVFEAGDVFEPTERELAQNASRLERVDAEATEEEQETEATEATTTGDASDGWPEGYTYERRGMWVYLTGPDGEEITSDRPSGAWKGTDEAQEAAWKHAGAD